jgi:hypothetical protein
VKFLKQYVMNVLLVFDCAVNVIVLFGAPDDTISGRSQRGFVSHKRAWTLLHNLLDRIQKNHCETALANDLSGADRHTEALDLE